MEGIRNHRNDRLVAFFHSILKEEKEKKKGGKTIGMEGQ
jgi:hypothetical protein